ncbi:MAG: hypothetical protein ACT4OY_09170 [Alphaproteobacteria bacterium]
MVLSNLFGKNSVQEDFLSANDDTLSSREKQEFIDDSHNLENLNHATERGFLHRLWKKVCENGLCDYKMLPKEPDHQPTKNFAAASSMLKSLFERHHIPLKIIEFTPLIHVSDLSKNIARPMADAIRTALSDTLHDLNFVDPRFRSFD